MAEEIEKRNEYNRDFVSTVMHELKTPITAIKGAAEVLQAGAVEREEPRRKFLANIRYESDRLTRMVGELSELTKLDVETLRGNKERVDYCSCLRDILDRIIPTFDNKHATFDTEGFAVGQYDFHCMDPVADGTIVDRARAGSVVGYHSTDGGRNFGEVGREELSRGGVTP